MGIMFDKLSIVLADKPELNKEKSEFRFDDIDYYQHVEFSKHEIAQLIQELQTIYNSMRVHK